MDEVRAATSVNVRQHVTTRAPHPTSEPTFNLRIEAKAKAEIRERLKKIFGLTISSIYPDLFGLAAHGIKGIQYGSEG